MEMTLDNLNTIALEVIARAENSKPETATVITLKGNLGSGKTTLVQEIARALGIKENLISPTFVIMKGYVIKDKKFKQLIHIDAYRLGKNQDLLKLGWQELLNDKNNLIIVEWPEHVRECIPTDAISIELAHYKEETRTIIF